MQRRHYIAPSPYLYLLHVVTHEELLNGVANQSLHHLQLLQRRRTRTPHVLHALQRVRQREQFLRLAEYRGAVGLQQRVLEDTRRKHLVDDGTREEATQILRVRRRNKRDGFHAETVELQVFDSLKGLFEPLFEGEGRESNAVTDSKKTGNELALLVAPVQRQRNRSHHRHVSKQRSIKLPDQTRGDCRYTTH